MPSETQSYLHLRLFRRTGNSGKKTKRKLKNKIGYFFTHLFKHISNNLIKKEVMTMAKEIKETKKQPEEKTKVKNETKGSCGCGCLPPMKKK